MKNLFFLILTLGLLSSCGVTKKYEQAKSLKSISLYEDYVSKYPRSKYLNQAKTELNVLYEERDWKSASQANTITAYKRFLSDYPYSKYGVNSEAKIKEIHVREAWSKSSNINTIYAFENFLNTYPDSRYAFDARNKIEQLKDNLAWNEAESQSTVMSYKKYINEFPNGARKATALDRLKEIEVIEPAWNRAFKTNTPAAYRYFLNDYSRSSYSSRAREKLSILESKYWRRATSQKSIAQYQKYLDNFPSGEHIAEAEKAIIDKEVDDIFKGDHGLLPPMSRTGSGYAYATTNDIEIYNNTNYTLTVRYSGSVVSKKIVLKPKQKEKFTLQNGEFRVAASVNAANINNYAGDEKLEGGIYTSEFYILTESY
jgi:outer membrane protein assembly factor BamD (BamD/ComL family)